MIGPALLWIILLGFAWVIGWSIFDAIRRSREKVTEPACGACRYPVRGLNTLACPECGADLRSAGILTPATRTVRPMGLATKAVIWTLLIVLIGGTTTSLLGIVPGLQATYYTGTQTYTPLSAAYSSLAIQTHGVGRGEGVRPAHSIALRLTRSDGTTARLALGRSGDDLVVHESMPETGLDGSKLTAEAINTWMLSAGVPQAAARVESGALAPAIAKIGARPRMSLESGIPMFAVAGGAWSTNVGPFIWARWLSLAFWTVLWAAGLRLLVRSRRRQSRGRATPLSAAATGAGTPATPPGSP